MYCINCGVQLAETERKCPLCGTDPLHPAVIPKPAQPLYPDRKLPGAQPRSGAVNASLLILFLIPMLLSFLVDLQTDGQISWFGFVAGALLLAYVVFALPLWFRRPNPIVFVPVGFAAAALYLLYINLATGGSWFMRFALPVTAGLGAIASALVVLLRCLRRGRLYIFGGAMIALGAFMLLIEFLLVQSFSLPFSGWSFYPMSVLVLLGCLLLYLGINRSAREMMERKFFI